MAWLRLVSVLPWALFATGSLLAQDGLPALPLPGERNSIFFAQETPGGQTETEGEGEENPFENALETDRDSFTPSTRNVAKGRFIVEAAHSFVDNRGVKETHSFPELIVRYGLSKRIELRFGWNYEVGGEGSDISGIDAAEEDFTAAAAGLERDSRLSYGLKLQTTEQEGWLPESALILQMFTPTSGRANDSSFVGTYVFGWELPNRWVLDAAFRYGTGSAELDRFDTWAPSVVVKVPIGYRIYTHAEYFGIFSTSKAQDFTKHYFSPGAHYPITPNLEVGFRVGWGLNEQSARFFSNVGFGWRF